MNLVYITSDDWDALYINGMLYTEGHSIDWPYNLNRLTKQGIIKSFTVKRASDTWISDAGNYPRNLFDVEMEE